MLAQDNPLKLPELYTPTEQTAGGLPDPLAPDQRQPSRLEVKFLAGNSDEVQTFSLTRNGFVPGNFMANSQSFS